MDSDDTHSRRHEAIDRRTFLALSAGLLAGVHANNPDAADTALTVPAMLRATSNSGFSVAVLFTTGDSLDGFRPPGIMDGMGAWAWDERTVRLFVNHELPPERGYPWQLANGTTLRGARISWFDIDTITRRVRAGGNAINEIVDRRGAPVTSAEQVSERFGSGDQAGLNALCSAQGYRRGQMGFVDDLLFTHEEVSAREDHPHGGSVWTLDVRENRLWALPGLGRGSWENVTAISTPDMTAADGHIALLMGDDLEFGAAPLYLWIGRKQPDGNFIARNGLGSGALYVWKADNGERSPQDWHGTGATRSGKFVPLETRAPDQAGKQGYDRDGYLDDLTLRKQAAALGAFMFSRPEDLHTNPRDGLDVVLCSTGHGKMFPADDWGTVYRIRMQLGFAKGEFSPRADILILYDGDDFGDAGIRSADNVVWASDGMIYIHEDRATKVNEFGGDTAREASTWRIDPDQPKDAEVIAVVDRSVVLPRNAKDIKANELGTWECCGLLDISADIGAVDNELVLVTAVQAHSVRGGALGDSDDLVQGGQLVLLTRAAD